MWELSGIFWKELYKSMQRYPNSEEYENEFYELIHNLWSHCGALRICFDLNTPVVFPHKSTNSRVKNLTVFSSRPSAGLAEQVPWPI